MNKKELKKIKDLLPEGYGPRLQEITGKSLVTIYNTLNGRTRNDAVIDAAIALAEENKKAREAKKEWLASL